MRTKFAERLSHHPNHSHAWRGAWDRPMFIDEDFEHPFTVARMTDHNVRGGDKITQVNELSKKEELYPPEFG